MALERTTPPANDEIELSIFGPGYGECILAHIGEGTWFVIDSCVRRDRQSAALQYLRDLGLNPASAVQIVAATHWHDDHVRGLSQVVDACHSAQFCCSAALRSEEFLALGNIYSRAPTRIPAGPAELARAFSLILSRRGRSGYQPIKWVQNDQTIWSSTLAQAGGVVVRLSALSPSDEMMTRAVTDIAKMLNAAKGQTPPARLSAPRPNHISAAMQLEIGERSILLGSDLEETGDTLIGWSAVLASSARPAATSSTFKVAHHGSKSGHHDGVWLTMLQKEPLALITPFCLAKHRIPTAEDRRRILSLTKRAFITADPDKRKSPKKRSNKVENLIRGTAKNRRLANPALGHIRWRASISRPSDAGLVQLFEEAHQLG
jgi:hypothetical protein